ncbi:hypothetical protein [Sphingobium sp. Leaf26]|uniref:hypothetical protein n=1 Tax=Sphingobium sp. Leaf26 TaxID=1735693 RepID=UPI000A9617B5|nr:hypothetical protein [Sphingobium sp. Leaf26]
MTMATRPIPPSPNAAGKPQPFTRKSSLGRKGAASQSRRPLAFTSPPSANLPGRAVTLSIDISTAFYGPLGPHHKMMGPWAAARDQDARLYTRGEARQRIEKLFNEEVLDILSPIKIVDLRVAVVDGEEGGSPPAITIFCDSIGQMDLGWIEKSNVLSVALFEQVAPVGMQAAAYEALASSLNAAVPMIGFADLMEELSAYYWDGSLDDEGAIQTMKEWRGLEDDDIDADQLPSGVLARRPAWMLAENAYPLKRLPHGLAKRIRRLRKARKAMDAVPLGDSAWRCHSDFVLDYFPEYMDYGTLPPMTIVPFDVFAREIDDVARPCMETGFYDIAGLYQLPNPAVVDRWFTSLKLGAELLLAAQDLIDTHPFHP